jgi:hypothetical protein
MKADTQPWPSRTNSRMQFPFSSPAYPCIFLLRSKCIALAKITDFLPLSDFDCHSCDNESRNPFSFAQHLMSGKQSDARTLKP